MIVVVTGGASSGKSRIAEEFCTAIGGQLVYLATMHPFGEEGARRVAKHRAMREGKGFATVECYGRLASVPSDAVQNGTVLLEDLGNLVANTLFGEEAPLAASCSVEDVIVALEQDALAFASRCGDVVIVGNEVGEDGIAYPQETQRYQDVLGRLSQRLAAASDIAIISVCGVPTVLNATVEARDRFSRVLSADISGEGSAA